MDAKSERFLLEVPISSSFESDLVLWTYPAQGEERHTAEVIRAGRGIPEELCGVLDGSRVVLPAGRIRGLEEAARSFHVISEEGWSACQPMSIVDAITGQCRRTSK